MTALFSTEGLIALAVGIPATIIFIWFQLRKRKLPASSAASGVKKVIGVPVKPGQKPNSEYTKASLMAAMQDRSLTDADRKRLRDLLIAENQAATAPKAVCTAITPYQSQGAVQITTGIGRYKTMIIQDVDGADDKERNIVFERLPVPVGNIVQLETSMPSKGGHHLVVKRGEFWLPYDPRLEPVISGDTPQDCYEAVNWYAEVNAVYANKYGAWEKINTILAVLMGCGFLLVAIVALDKLGK